MYAFRWALPVALAAMATAATAEPLTFGLSLDRARSGSPDLQAQRLKVDAAQSAARSAAALPDPKLMLGVENFPVSGPPAGRLGADEMTMLRLGVSQEVPNGAKRRARLERADADIRAAQAGDVLAVRRVRVATALAWIDLYYAKRRLAAIDDIAAKLRPLWGANSAAVASGSLRPGQTVEAAQVEAALDDRRSDLRAQIGKARADLTRWTGDPDADVSGDPPSFDVDPVALRAGLDRHPSLTASVAAEDQARAEVSVARADKRPDWSFDVSYGRRDPRFGDMVSASASVSLPLFGRTLQDPIIAARLADANRVRLEREATRRELLASLDGDLADHTMHHEQLMRAHETLVPLAQRRADLETASYAANRANLSDVVSAFAALAQAELDALDREAMAERDAARIVLTYGTDNQ